MVSRFAVQDFTLEMIRHPAEYSCAEELGRLAWVGRLPERLLGALRPLYPNYDWVLHKPEGREP